MLYQLWQLRDDNSFGVIFIGTMAMCVTYLSERVRRHSRGEIWASNAQFGRDDCLSFGGNEWIITIN